MAEFFYYNINVPYLENNIILCKKFDTSTAFIKSTNEWQDKVALRLDYVGEELFDKMVTKFEDEPDYYFVINPLIDAWDILTDRNECSDSLFVRLLDFYQFETGKELPSALSRNRDCVEGQYFI